jgi:hypothetical protein
MLEDRNNSSFALYLFNCQSECHEEKWATCQVECIFQHTLKKSPQLSKNCIYKCVTRHLSRPPYGHLPFRD